MVTAALLSEERDVRIHAALRIELDADAIYALRNAIATDDDAEVRSVCVERLGLVEVARLRGRIATAVRLVLVDALEDESPMVRERAIASLARHFEHDAHDAHSAHFATTLREMIRMEPVWRVRRAAVRAIANFGIVRAQSDLVFVLDDPFWRVRYAAIQAFADHPSSEAIIADAPRTGRRDAALAYLRARWSDANAEIKQDETSATFEVNDALADEDPAVVAATLAKVPDDALSAARLASFLRSPHEVLRRAASKRLLARANIEDLRAALALLEDPRVPYVDETVRRVLARTETRALRDRILREGGAAVAIAWSITETADRGDVDVAIDAFLTHESDMVRRAAIDAQTHDAPIASLIRALEDDDVVVRATAAALLSERAEGRDALVAHDFSRESPCVFRAAISGDHTPHALIRAALRASDPFAVATAIAKLDATNELDDAERSSALADEDPWIRAAALDAAHAMNALRADPDPQTRRDAFDRLIAARAPLDDALIVAAHSDDAWLRARAADALRKNDRVSIEIVLRMTRDPAPMVRSAAAEALAARKDAANACFAIVERDPPADERLRLAAHGRLVMEGSQRAFDALERDLATHALSPEARWALLGMTLAYADEIRRASTLTYEPREPVRAREPAKIVEGERRTLGATNVAMSPLVVSGAFELQQSWLARARESGVNAFFWEPEYRAMSAFITAAERKEDLVVICGTYEADRKTIERDVDRALKRLRIDSLGVMLLFWVRSPARLNDEAFDALERLKKSGKVRAIGFSTHLRDLAARAITERAWDVVMTRHSAAHTGLETTLLPIARERNVGILTFSALVYGRMLSNTPTMQVDAADCYRYSLAQPGVTACITAPRRQRELEQNLAVMRRSSIAQDTIARLREHGARVREDNRAFMSLVRRP